MPDPYAPPQDSPSRGSTAGYAPTPLTQTYEPAPPYESPRSRHDRPWRDNARDNARDSARYEARPEPARPGMFWVIAAVGVGILCLARLLLYGAVAGDLPGDRVAPALFGVLGLVTLSIGLCLAAVLQRGLATSWRIALLLGAGFFASVGAWDGLAGALFL
jgi:hypothetical protein